MTTKRTKKSSKFPMKDTYAMNADKADHNVYIKEGGRYRPIGYWWEGNHDYLTEGVWVVSRHKHSVGTTNGQYLKEQYGIDKVCDLKSPSFAELGGIAKLEDDILEILSDVDRNKYYESSIYDQVRMILYAIDKLSREKYKDERP